MLFRKIVLAGCIAGVLGTVNGLGATETVVPPPPPVAESAFVEIEIEVPDVAAVYVDGVVDSRSGSRRMIRLSRNAKKSTCTIMANWSEMGQDRRVERTVTLNGKAKVVFTLDDLTTQEQQLLDLTNAARARSGLPMLRMDPRLCRAARQHSANMARYNTMSHNLEGRSHQHRTAAAGYSSGMVAENICYSQYDPQAAINTWLNSSGHRANMLSYNYNDLGVGIGYNSAGQPYYTQVFGR